MIAQSMLIALATLAVLPVQSGRGAREPGGQTSMCSVSGATCLFGTVPGCSVTCGEPFTASCKPAYCFFGFPEPAECWCSNC